MDVFQPGNKDLSRCFLMGSISGEIETAVFEKRFLRKDGHVVLGRISSSLVRDSRGKPLYFISHVQDVTERRRAEEALRQSATTLPSVFRATPASICIVKSRVFHSGNELLAVRRELDGNAQHFGLQFLPAIRNWTKPPLSGDTLSVKKDRHELTWRRDPERVQCRELTMQRRNFK